MQNSFKEPEKPSSEFSLAFSLEDPFMDEENNKATYQQQTPSLSPRLGDSKKAITFASNLTTTITRPDWDTSEVSIQTTDVFEPATTNAPMMGLELARGNASFEEKQELSFQLEGLMVVDEDEESTSSLGSIYDEFGTSDTSDSNKDRSDSDSVPEDEPTKELDQEQRIKRSLLYAAGGMGGMALVGWGIQKIMSIFEKSEDDDVGAVVAITEHGAETGAEAAASSGGAPSASSGVVAIGSESATTATNVGQAYTAAASASAANASQSQSLVGIGFGWGGGATKTMTAAQ